MTREETRDKVLALAKEFEVETDRPTRHCAAILYALSGALAECTEQSFSMHVREWAKSAQVRLNARNN